MHRRVHISLRLTREEKVSLTQLHKASRHGGSFSSYLRQLVLGKISHPLYKDDSIDFIDSNEILAGQKIVGPAEHQNHYLAVVIAMFMLRIKMDPDFHKYIKAEPLMFQSLIDEIRGYKFDDKTELKMPLHVRDGE